jgi:hypothetical protein
MDPQTAVKLAAITYCDDIQGSLNQNLPGWTAAWVPTKSVNGNLAFIAYDGASQYAVAIRGSLLNFTWDAFYNWFYQDLDVFFQVPWTIGGDSKAMIAQGASNGLGDLNQLVDSNGVSMISFLEKALTSGTSLTVTGHSLGGNLTTVLAPWLYYTLKSANKSVPMSVYTFAAPAAGNQAFANDYDKLFGGSSWRYQLQNDIIPMFPMHAQVLIVSTWYSPAPLASALSVQYQGHKVTLQEAFFLISGAIGVSEYYYGSYYTQTNQKQGWVQLTTSLCNQWQQNTIDAYYNTVRCYHSIQTYAKAVGVADGVACKSALGLSYPDGLISMG